MNFVGERGVAFRAPKARASCAAARSAPISPPTRGFRTDTRLWAALQDASGGTWGGCVYDVDAVLAALAAGRKATRS